MHWLFTSRQQSGWGHKVIVPGLEGKKQIRAGCLGAQFRSQTRSLTPIWVGVGVQSCAGRNVKKKIKTYF